MSGGFAIRYLGELRLGRVNLAISTSSNNLPSPEIQIRKSDSRGFFNERFDYSVECLRLFPVAKVAGLIDDVHFRFGIAVGDDFEERMAAFELGGRIVVAPD